MFLFVADNPIVYRLLFSMTINRDFIHFCVPFFRCKLLEDNWKRKLPFERVSSLLTNPILGIGTKLIIQSSHQRSSLTSNVLTFQLFPMSVLMAHASFWLIVVEIGIDSGYQKFKWFADIKPWINQGWQIPEKQKRFRCQSSDQAWTLSGWVFFSGFEDIYWICMKLPIKSAFFK